MGKGRLEAFSDGVIAIIITIMVLELKVPHHGTLEALGPLIPVFASYVLSFIYVGIYWNNHHHLLHAARTVDGRVLWANLHFLFWLSLIPFVTNWLGENHVETVPVAAYGLVLLMCALSYTLLARALVAHDGKTSTLAKALGKDYKGSVSILLYAAAIGLSVWLPWLGVVLYVVVALVWFIPDRRIEALVTGN